MKVHLTNHNWDKLQQTAPKTYKDESRRVKFLRKNIKLLKEAIRENKALGTKLAIEEAKKQESRLKDLIA